MALVLANRVQETTATTGTGTITLAGAVAGYQSFAAIGDANTTYYTITSGNNWEVGIGTYTSSGTTLSRDTVLSSSAGGTTKITLAGTSTVFADYPAEKSVNYDASSNVGIGTTSPASKLDIATGDLRFSSTAQRILGDFSNATETNRLLFQSATTNGNTNVNAIPNGTSVTAAIGVMNNADPTNTGRLSMVINSTETSFRSAINGTGTYLPLTFYSGGSERIRLDTSGNVGIGTSAPGGKLHVVAGTDNSILFRGPISFATGGSIYAVNAANTVIAPLELAASAFYFNAGNVGIGITDPGYKLDIAAADTTAGLGYAMRIRANATAGAGAIQFTDAGVTTQWGFLAVTSTTVTLDASGSSLLAFRTNSAERMRITSGGDVGIGTTPVQQNGRTLQVDGGAGAADYRLTNNATGAAINNGGLYSLIGVDNYLWNLEAGFLSFGTSNAERMRITSAGLVGIGTSSPAQTLDVVGIVLAREDTAAGATPVILRNSNTGNNTTKSSSALFQGTDTVGTVKNIGSIGFFPDDANYIGANLRFLVRSGDAAPTERMRISSAGDVGVGTSSPSQKLTVQGAQLTIPAAGWSAGQVAYNYLGDTNGGIKATNGGNVNVFAYNGFDVTVNGPSPTTAMTITAGANVGIGTTSPTYKLEVFGSPAWIRNFAGTPASPTETQDWPVSAFNIASFGDFTLQTMLAFTLPNDGNYDTGYSTWNFKLDQTASSTTSAGVIGMQFGGPGYLLFAPGGTEKVRINSSGNFLVNTTAAEGGGKVVSVSTVSADPCYAARNSAGASSYFHYFINAANSAIIGSISNNANTGVLYNVTSDARLKHDIVDAPDAASLIDAIQVRSFKWNADNSEQRYGFIAQELVEVAPEAVSQPADPDDMMGVDYSKLVPMLIKEVQSLRARVAQLEGN